RAELQFESLAQDEVAKHREVEVPGAGAASCAARQVAELGDGRPVDVPHLSGLAEGGCIEPSIDSSIGQVHGLARHAVGDVVRSEQLTGRGKRATDIRWETAIESQNAIESPPSQ